MLNQLKHILEIQELDMKMIRLMRVKRERKKELNQIEDLRSELNTQLQEKEKDIAELNETASTHEQKIEEIAEKYKKLEDQQSSVKKVDEFNALTQEMTKSERERIATEQKLSDLVDKRSIEEEFLEKIKESLSASEESSLLLEKEIRESINFINVEGQKLKIERDRLASSADPEIMRIYERLLRNKKDRVVVPLEHRTCSGCHISLTAQHENLVRKELNLIFCEHCSRVHYWPQESEPTEAAGTTTKRRRRRTSTT